MDEKSSNFNYQANETFLSRFRLNKFIAHAQLPKVRNLHFKSLKHLRFRLAIQLECLSTIQVYDVFGRIKKERLKKPKRLAPENE